LLQLEGKDSSDQKTVIARRQRRRGNPFLFLSDYTLKMMRNILLKQDLTLNIMVKIKLQGV